jgi:hypothetical protein
MVDAPGKFVLFFPLAGKPSRREFFALMRQLLTNVTVSLDRNVIFCPAPLFDSYFDRRPLDAPVG